MRFKSDSCFGRTGEPLNSYTDKSDAASHAAFIKREHGTSFAAYECDRCGFLHLSPNDRITESTVCSYCKGANGQSKDLYITRQTALRRAEILRRENGIQLHVYRCPHQNGWHLTRSRNTR